MRAEVHCPCGARRGCKPNGLAARTRCERCDRDLVFRPPGEASDRARWLTVGGKKGPARLAVPMPIGVPLMLGSSQQCWLTLPGDEIDERQTELTLESDGRIIVKHLGASGATWINQARILSGVLHEGDVLRIGPYVLQIETDLSRLVSGAEPDLVVVEEDEAEEAGDEEETYGIAPRPEASAWTGRRKVRLVATVLIIFCSGFYLTKKTIWHGVSEEMPTDTEYRCPVDGTVFRAAWSSTPPRCPECGQLCFGSMQYRQAPEPRRDSTSRPEDEAESSRGSATKNGSDRTETRL